MKLPRLEIKRMKKKLKSQRGSSLIEMLICVLLVSMVSAIGVGGLIYAYRGADNAQKEAEAMEVGSMILSRIEGELNGMPASGKVYFDNNPENYYDIIAFDSSSGVPIYITNDDGELLVHYRETHSQATTIAPSDWTFDQNAYHGMTIKHLWFSCHVRNSKLVIVTNLQLENENGKVYEFTRSTGCFNKEVVTLEEGVDWTKFSKAELLSDDNYWDGLG